MQSAWAARKVTKVATGMRATLVLACPPDKLRATFVLARPPDKLRATLVLACPPDKLRANVHNAHSNVPFRAAVTFPNAVH